MKLFLQSLILGAGCLTAGVGYAQAQPAKATAPASMAAPAPAAKASTKVVQKTPSEPAAGGGDGKVWVNSASKTYHCPGTKYYGKTKAGEYLTEADAKAKGNHANHKKACS